MKKSLLIIACALLCCGTAFGWGRKGHAKIARIAETHLTKTTQKKIAEIMHGESISGYASYADEQKSKLLVDYGFDPTDGTNRIGTLPHTFESDMNYEPFRGINDNGRYVKNCIHYIEKYAGDLKDYKALDDSTDFTDLVLLVHFVGDMHCPEHIRYNPEDMTIGYYKVNFRKEDIRYHTIWDDMIIDLKHPWSFGDLAHNFDSASPAEIEEVTAGGPYDWGRDVAKCCWPTHQIKPGAVLDLDWYWEQMPLMRSQIRKAGYRLAKELNMIFDPAYARKHRK